jgi:hypothetical protein
MSLKSLKANGFHKKSPDFIRAFFAYSVKFKV